MSYTITANGTTMGTYEGSTRDEAILAYVREAGYASVAEAADALSQTPEMFLADIIATPDDLVLTVETVDIVNFGMCAEVRIERTGGGLISKGRCYMGHMPSLESCVARALEGAVGGALLRGVPAPTLVAVARRVHADDAVWARADSSESWAPVETSYRL